MQAAQTFCPVASNSDTANIRRQFISFDPVARKTAIEI